MENGQSAVGFARSAKHILALDQGTTSSRAIVFGHEGQVVAMAQKEFRQIFPRGGWVEHDPQEIWSSQAAAAGEAMERAGVTAGGLAAIAIANQRETAVVWDRRTGRPVCNAIVWQDRRSAGMCERLKADGLEGLFQARTGLVLDPYFSGTKVRWMLDNVPGARQAAEAGELAFGTVDTWLLWKLTGGAVHATDVTNASRTLMYDIHAGRWDDELLAALGVPASMLPRVNPSSHVAAEASPRAAGFLDAPVPVAGMIGDQQAALFGQLCTRAGMVKNTYGTGCFLLLNTAGRAVPSGNHLLTTIAWQAGGAVQYALEGSVFIGGAAVQWLRDGLGLIRSAGEVEALAAGVPDSGGVYLVPAFAGLGAPHWDPYARGLLAGITRGTTAAHVARAALEGIALQVADVLEAMQADSGIRICELRADGGAAANNLLMQIQADVLGVPVVRPRILETTALGAAYLAGLAVGYWPNPEALASHWQADRTFQPGMSADKVAALKAGWRKAVERAKGWEE